MFRKIFRIFFVAYVAFICEEFGIENFSVDSDWLVNVDGDVDLSFKKLKRLPLKFGRVSGYFNCYRNQLVNLRGSPRVVGGFFNCSCNRLTSLNGGPKEVGGRYNCDENLLISLVGSPEEVVEFNCSRNKLVNLVGSPTRVRDHFYCPNNRLTSLEGCPREVGGDFGCSFNKLTTLEGGPREVGGQFHCTHNQLISLEGAPRDLGGNFRCNGNPIFVVYKLFPNYKSLLDSGDWEYLRRDKIIKFRFKEALLEVGKEVPDHILGYEYI